MVEQPSVSFARPNIPGDPVSVMVLVEDSFPMYEKWHGIRDFYLPTLLESLRMADLTVPMRVWWFTNSPTFEAPLTSNIDLIGQCEDNPIQLSGTSSEVGISTTVIRRSVDTFVASVDKQRGTRHCIIIASRLLYGPGAASTNTYHTGSDSLQSIAVVLSQEHVHLHLINDPGPDVEAFHDFFKRTLYYGDYQEVPVWFNVDSSLSIRLSCAPANPAMEALAPILNSAPQTVKTKRSSSPEQPATSTSIPSSPTQPSSSRKPASSSSGSRSKKGKKAEPTTYSDSTGLVSFLQQMHGLTKKRTYGAKPAKRSLSDLRSSTAARPILPRLDTSSSPSYTLPPHCNATGSDKHLPEPSPSQSFFVSRTTSDDRRARRHAPYLPTPPAVEPSLSDSYITSPSSSAAALRSLEAMSPRLTEFHTMDQPLSGVPSDWLPGGRTLGRDGDVMSAHPHYGAAPAGAVLHRDMVLPLSTPSSPLATSSAYTGWGAVRHSLPAPLPLDAPKSSEQTQLPYGTPCGPGQDTTMTPLPSPSLTTPTSVSDNADDQPFVVTPEYEALVQARFEEMKRQAALTAPTSAPAHAPGLYPFSADARIRQAQYVPAHALRQPAAYAQGGYLEQQPGAAFVGTPAVWGYAQGQGQVRPFAEYSPSSNWYPS